MTILCFQDGRIKNDNKKDIEYLVSSLRSFVPLEDD